MKLGALLLPSMAWPDLVRTAQEAEDAGFSAVWVDDHIAHPGDPASGWMEAWAVLAGLAASTRSVTIGPLVSNVVLRHPALLALQAETVDAISGGRLDVGIGAGYAPTDHAALGAEPWGDAERFDRFASAVEHVRGALGDRPLTVAAHGPRAIRLAARHADAWVSYGGFGLETVDVLAVTRRRIELLDAQAEGRRVRRRLLAGSAALTRDPIWESVDAFDDFVGRVEEIGVDELALHWPPRATNPTARDDVVDEIVSRLAR